MISSISGSGSDAMLLFWVTVEDSAPCVATGGFGEILVDDQSAAKSM